MVQKGEISCNNFQPWRFLLFGDCQEPDPITASVVLTRKLAARNRTLLFQELHEQGGRQAQTPCRCFQSLFVFFLPYSILLNLGCIKVVKNQELDPRLPFPSY